jgi:hypothetical protein
MPVNEVAKNREFYVEETQNAMLVNQVEGDYKKGGMVGSEIEFNKYGETRTGTIYEDFQDNTYAVQSGTSKVLIDKDDILRTIEPKKETSFSFFDNGGGVQNKIQLKNFSDLKQGDVIRRKERIGTTIFVVNKSPVQSRAYKNEYDALVTCIVSNTNFYKPLEEYYITSVIKYGKLGNVDYLGKWNYNDKIDYSIYLPKSNKKFADGGDVPNQDKMFQLPLEMVIYVPSTQDVDKVISVDKMDKRVDEVKIYLANKFGGYTSADKLGGFVDSTGNLVNEDVVQVTSFSTKEAYAENKEELIKQLAKWCEEWGQESIGFEFEGDLMYVPQKI